MPTRRQAVSLLAAGLAPAHATPMDSQPTATQALRDLAEGRYSSRELVTQLFARIRQFNPKINAFVTLREEAALAEAAKADAARKSPQGPLHGLPITVKDAFATAGTRTTAGSKIWEQYVPTVDAVAVAKLRKAGAIILGKTNLPEFSADLQAYNEIAGTTNNPFDPTRTCGGSTGGGAAAVAAGFTCAELGSDSGGSIRIPAHFCGVYGHKSTVGLVSRIGWMPPLPGEFRGPNEWSVAGPIARSAEDLKLMLEVMAGPSPEDAVAYRWIPPPPRYKTLKEFRVGFVSQDKFCPVAPETSKALAPFFEAITKAGGTIREGWPAGFDPRRNWETFRFLTTAFQASGVNEAQRKALEGELGGPHEEVARATLEAVRAPYEDWEKRHVERLKTRQVWYEYFKSFDVFLSPVAILPAFAHDHTMPRHRRWVDSESGKRPYQDLSLWIAHAGLSGCPATVAPVAQTPGGLPIGIQIMGPFLEDLTPIHFASLLTPLTGGFRAPKLAS